jgi:hypothetical protein
MPVNPFEELLRDKVTLAKKDGTIVRKDIAASVQSDKIFVYDPHLPIEVGDHFLRQLPSGLVEDFVVDDPGFRSGLHSIAPHFQTKVHRSDRAVGQPQTITNSATLFTEMLKAVAQIATKSERETIAATISAMSAAQERQDGTFLSKYQDFIATAANHMTIFAPFLPALSKLLS